MITKQKVKRQLDKVDNSSDVHNVAMAELYRWNRQRNQQTQKISLIILFLAIVCIDFIMIKNLFTDEPTIDSSGFVCQEDTNRIVDADNFLIGEKRNTLLEEVKSTNGSIYKVVFIVSDKKDMTKTIKEAYGAAINDKLYDVSEDVSSCFPLDTVMILYNSNTEEYALYPTSCLIKNTHIFDLVDTSAMSSPNSNSYFSIPDNIILNTTKAYEDLLTGTPAEVYKKVFEYISTYGYTDEQIEERLATFVKTVELSNDIGISFALIMGSIVFGAISAVFILRAVDMREPPKRISRIYEQAANAVIQKKQEERLQAEEKEKIKKSAQDKVSAVAQSQNKERPMAELISLLSKIQSINSKVNDSRDKLIEVFKIADSVLTNQQKENNPLVARFKSYYLNAFKENLEEIIFHAQKHATFFNTPEEIPVLLKTFDMYEKITNKFIDQSELAGTQSIEINLTVLEQMATMDGLVDSTDMLPNHDKITT